jgi:hypothetical protein
MLLASCSSEIGCSVMVLDFVPSCAEQHEGILLRWKVVMQTITGIAVARRTWQFSALPYSLILFTHTV